MKLPAVAIAAAFACGIVAGLYPPVANSATASALLAWGFALASSLVIGGILLALRQQLKLGAAASMLSWILLGILSAGIAQQPLSPNHILTLLDGDRLNLHSPLRWQGRLRDEPAKLPWGYGYEIELAGVEYQNALLPVQGGLRLASRRTLAKREFPIFTRETRSRF